MTFKVVLKWVLYLIFMTVLGMTLLFSFYIWMIYGIHSSDEGNKSLACEYDQNFQVTRAEMISIQEGKRVISQVDPLLCKKDRKDFP